MAAWLIPALKAVLPHIGTIISAAGPVFTKKSGDVQQQVTELQAAVSQNAQNIKELAAQLETTVSAIEQSAKRTTLLCIAAIVLSAVALVVSLVVGR
jgi:hypothetical protein